jgi:hypothetical protein
MKSLKPAQGAVSAPVSPVPSPEATMPLVKPTDKITPHFTWKDALFMPQLNRMADASDGVDLACIENLKKTFAIMEKLRTLLGDRAIVVHCALRPTAYNKLVKGAKKSAHLYGMAVDFHVEGLTCDEVRAKLTPVLDTYRIRMEDLPGSNWVHIDIRDSYPRLFKP